MPETLVLVGRDEIFMTAEIRDKLAAQVPLAPVDGNASPLTLPEGYRITVLTEAELKAKAKAAKPHQPARQIVHPPVARSVPFQHPKATSREAARRRRQLARREGKTDA